MTHLQAQIDSYLEYCRCQKRLDSKTLKAYRTDLAQFSSQIPPVDAPNITPEILENFIACLHQAYKPRTAKRKIASLKAFFHYLEYREQSSEIRIPVEKSVSMTAASRRALFLW